MPRVAIVILLTTCFAARASAQSDLLFYDGFDYTLGEDMAGYNGGVAPGTGQHNVTYNVDWRFGGLPAGLTPYVQDANLTATGAPLPAPTGHAAAIDSRTTAVARVEIPNKPTDPNRTLYWSGILQVNQVEALLTTVNGGFIAGFNNITSYQTTSVTVMGAILALRRPGTDPLDRTYLIGTGANAAVPATGSTDLNPRLYDTTLRAEGVPLFIVASYEVIEGADNDVGRMWISPAANTFGALAAPTPTLVSTITPTSAGVDLTDVASFALRNIDTNPPAAVDGEYALLDEIRVGTTWASVTPSTAPPEQAGDYNNDQKVDADDLAAWQGTFGNVGVDLPADGDGNGVVDGGDMLIWQANFGAGVPQGGIAAVPEPSSRALVSLLLGVMLIGFNGCPRLREH